MDLRQDPAVRAEPAFGDAAAEAVVEVVVVGGDARIDHRDTDAAAGKAVFLACERGAAGEGTSYRYVHALHELFGLEAALAPHEEAPAEVARLDARRQRRGR